MPSVKLALCAGFTEMALLMLGMNTGRDAGVEPLAGGEAPTPLEPSILSNLATAIRKLSEVKLSEGLYRDRLGLQANHQANHIE